MKKFNNYVLSFMFYVLCSLTNAYGLEFKEYLSHASSLRGSALNKIKVTNLKSLPNYTQDVPAKDYYAGIKQSKANIEQVAKYAAQTDPTAKDIYKNFATRQKVIIDQNSNEIKKAKDIQKNAIDVTGGISDKYAKQLPKDNQPNQDFNKAATDFATINAAGADMLDSKGSRAFSGYSLQCTKDGWGYSNCCQGSGWGPKMHLGSCSDEEKRLGIARQNGLAIYVGDKCTHRNIFGCYVHADVYCVFGSKLARIAQEKGRKDQLGIGFGSGGSPNCLGISIEKLQQIDFGKIDFSSAYSDIKNNINLPDISDTSNKLSQDIVDKASARRGA